MPLLDSSDELESPSDKFPRGACYWCWYWSKPERLGEQHFFDAVGNLDSVDNTQAWLGKLNELDADAAKKEAVADRLRELLD